MVSKVIAWSPLHPSDFNQFQFGNYGLLILNQQIKLRPVLMDHLWKNARIRSTADGGTDRWFEYCSKHGFSDRFPETVSGDFDSISSSTLSTCRARGVKVVETEDQNFTDFQKSLGVMSETYKDNLDSVVVLCETAGRIDQIYSNMNTLGTAHEFFTRTPPPTLFILSSDSISWRLTAGSHRISVPKYILGANLWCALLPYDNDDSGVVTTGLKWNLNGQSIKFGGLISSSNTYDGSPEVTITAKGSLIWSMGLSQG